MRMPAGSRRRGTAVVCLVLAVVVPWGHAAQPAAAQVTELNGSAYGAYVHVGLFGGPPSQVGATPVVVLPPTGGKEDASLPELIAQFGPATVFGGRFEDPGRNPSGELTVTTEGEIGPDGYVTSAATVTNVGPGPLVADEIYSSCRSDQSGVTGSATFKNAVVETSYDAETQEAVTTEPVPESPAPNTAMEGTIDHVGDRFRVVFNEQVVEGDTIIVRAVHMYLLGPIAVGDLIIGQSVCGLSADDDGSTTPPTLAPGATTVPVTDPAGTGEDGSAGGDDPDESAAASGSGSDGGGALPILGSLVGVGGLGLGALLIVRRRRTRGSPGREKPPDGFSPSGSSEG